MNIMIRALALAILILFFTAIGCGTETGPRSVDFGADYTIVVTEGLPSVTNNTLRVILFYFGCEPNHEFTLNAENIDTNEYQVWLTKITPNQDCQQSFEETRVFTLPDETNQSRILFTGPNFEGVLRNI